MNIIKGIEYKYFTDSYNEVINYDFVTEIKIPKQIFDDFGDITICGKFDNSITFHNIIDSWFCRLSNYTSGIDKSNSKYNVIYTKTINNNLIRYNCGTKISFKFYSNSANKFIEVLNENSIEKNILVKNYVSNTLDNNYFITTYNKPKEYLVSRDLVEIITVINDNKHEYIKKTNINEKIQYKTVRKTFSIEIKNRFSEIKFPPIFIENIMKNNSAKYGDIEFFLVKKELLFENNCITKVIFKFINLEKDINDNKLLFTSQDYESFTIDDYVRLNTSYYEMIEKFKEEIIQK